MTARRRSRRSRSSSADLLAFLAVAAVLVALAAAHLLGWLMLAAGVGAAAWLAVRYLPRPARPVGPAAPRDSRPGPAPVQPSVPVTAPPPAAAPAPGLSAAEAAALRAELEDARRSIAKMEDDAGRHDHLIGRIEELTGRPIELHIASLERAANLYGPAMAGKTGRRK